MRPRLLVHGWLIVALGSLLALQGCAPAFVRNPIPEKLYKLAMVPGQGHIRYWGDTVPDNLTLLAEERAAQIRATRPWMLSPRHEIAYLALSGGGADGAFGAGLLTGWSEAGTRPEFEVVTGISTGALIAPFAFLGRDHDPTLHAIYTSYGTNDIADLKIFQGLLGGVALTETNGLDSLIASHVTERELRLVAAEHRKGRRLLIGTTNLDAQRPVIWDMGAIAASGRPDALELFRNVLRASAAIPGFFPPVFIHVEADGEVGDEMHVDGGTTAEVFFLPSEVVSTGAKVIGNGRSHRRLYVISNGRIGPEWKPVQPATLKIATRSLSTLIKSQWRADVARLYEQAMNARVGFRLAAIPPTVKLKSEEPFDLEYMRELFATGKELGRRGYDWAEVPPGMDALR